VTDDPPEDLQQPEFGLVMPFITVATEGGPHDDVSYVAGWEMGVLDAEMRCTSPAIIDRWIHAENESQADLIAMKNGYKVKFGAEYEEAPGWVRMVATRVEEAIP
jgi:hypothetical protein